MKYRGFGCIRQGLCRLTGTSESQALFRGLALFISGLLTGPVFSGSADFPFAAIQRRFVPVVVPGELRVLNYGARMVADKSAFKETRPSHQNRVLVAYREGASRERRRALLRRAETGLALRAFQPSRHFDVITISAQALASGVTVENTIARLRQDPDVLTAEPDFLLRAQKLPNDPDFSKLWGLRNTGKDPLGQTTTAGDDVDAGAAWDLTTGGAVIVAVIDTGVDYTHEDLSANILRDISGNVVGYDFANKDADPMDDNGHGTHVAGTIGAVGNNGIGIAGVNWKVRIMPLKFLDESGSGHTSDAIACVDYAIAHGAQVINSSWGGAGFSTLMLQAIKRAEGAGILFTAAAGNSGRNIDTNQFFPANYNRYASNVISVAASDGNDLLASFSNYGRIGVDIIAPGYAIYSTLPGNRYGVLSGTSMAAPHVTGAIALIKSLYPAAPLEVVRERLLYSVDRPSTLARYARGNRLNLAGALEDDRIAPGTPENLAATAASASGFRIQWAATGDDGHAGIVSVYEAFVRNAEKSESQLLNILPGPPGTIETASVTGLLPDTLYEIGLRAIDNAGNKSEITTVAGVRTKSAEFNDSAESNLRFSTGSQWLVTSDEAHSGTHSYSSGYKADIYRDLTSTETIRIENAATLKFWAKTDIEENADYLWIYVIADNITNYEGYATGVNGWTEHAVDLTKYYGKDIRIRFVITSSASDAIHKGVYLDDIRILPSARVFLDDAEGEPFFVGMSPWTTSQEASSSGTRSYSDSPHSQYGSKVSLPLVQKAGAPLSKYDSPSASFRARIDLEPNRDFLDVFASPDDGSTWEFLASLTGTTGDWRTYSFGLPGYQSARLMFVLRTSESVDQDGVYIDDISIWGDPYSPLFSTERSQRRKRK